MIFKHLTAGPVWLGIQHGLPKEGSVVQVENGKTTKVDLKTGKTGIIEPDGTIRDQGNPSAQVLGKFVPNIETTEKKGGEATNSEVKTPDASLTKTLRVQVIDQQGKPIQGALVKPTGLRTKVDHGSWWGIRPQDEHLFASGTTDAEGKISVSFPSHAGDELTTGTVIVLVQHPEACSAEVEINIDEPKPVMLVRGTKVILSAQPLPGVSFSRIEADIVDDERQARLQKWTHAPDGKSVSAHLPDGNDLVRLVGMTPQGKIYFSDSVPFSLLAKPEGGKTLQSGDSELKKSFVMHEGGMVKGALDSSVPRPVKGGWIVGCVSSQLPDHGNSLINTWWTSSDVAEDGSFALTNLPAGTLEIVAGCNGYVSKDESTRMFAGIHQARLIGLDRDQQLSIPMEPTGEVRVEVQTPDGKPLSGATVGFSPNQSMGNCNGLLGARFNSAEMLSHQETDSATPAKQQPPSNPFYAKTDSSGVATIKGLPVGAQHFSVISDSYYMPYEILPPPNVPRRRQTVTVPGNVSVTMEQKQVSSLLGPIPTVDATPEIIGKLPVGKLAFVTSASFGSPGIISVLGGNASPFPGGNPEFTADGNRLIYDNQINSESGLFIRDLSKNSTSSIFTKTTNADDPSLSPDWKTLAFTAWPPGRKTSHIYVSNIDGSGAVALTSGDHYDWSPRWSPDGTKILFESTRDGHRQIYVMDADGKNQTNLTHDQQLSHHPSWSPDGSHIAYMSRGEKNHANIFVMKSDGSDKQDISKGTTRDSEPAWSPDGKWIAFTRTEKNPPEREAMDIWIMKTDGSDQQQITRNKEQISSYEPTWAR